MYKQQIENLQKTPTLSTGVKTTHNLSTPSSQRQNEHNESISSSRIRKNQEPRKILSRLSISN